MKQEFQLVAAPVELIKALAADDTKTANKILKDDLAADAKRNAEREAQPAIMNDPKYANLAPNGLFIPSPKK